MTRARAWVEVVAMALVGCGASGRRGPATPALSDLRATARTSADGEIVGRWALSEGLAPGGTAAEAAAARTRLDAVPHLGMWASLARAVIDEAHGDPRSAAEG